MAGMKMGPVKPVHVLALLAIGALVVAVLMPARSSPDHAGRAQVAEATFLLTELRGKVEAFHAKHGRVPGVDELDMPEDAGKYVGHLSGDNPYYATMKKSGVHPPVAGRTLGWSFDPASGWWDTCTLGTVELRFKSLDCRDNKAGER